MCASQGKAEESTHYLGDPFAVRILPGDSSDLLLARDRLAVLDVVRMEVHVRHLVLEVHLPRGGSDEAISHGKRTLAHHFMRTGLKRLQ